MTGASFITPNFLLPYSAQVSDYRCAVNAAGTAVVFERTVFKSAGGSGNSQLYLLDLTQSGAAPTLFLQDQSIEISDRPDWSWVTGDVAFNFGPDIWVGVVDSGGGAFRSLGAQTARMNYPTWFPDGQALAVENDTPIPGTTDPVAKHDHDQRLDRRHHQRRPRGPGSLGRHAERQSGQSRT